MLCRKVLKFTKDFVCLILFTPMFDVGLCVDGAYGYVWILVDGIAPRLGAKLDCYRSRGIYLVM